MMRAFWERLIRVNARLVFLAAFLLLAGAAIWSLLRAAESPGTTVTVPSLTNAERTWTPPAQLPETTVAPTAASTGELPSSAFVSTTIDEYLTRKEAERIAAEKAAAEAAAKAAEEAAAKAAAEAAAKAAAQTPPPPPPPKIVLRYRGILQRMDGSALALIERSDNKTTAFFREGEQIAGVTIGAFGRQQVILTTPAGAAVTLGVNESYTVSGE